MVCPGNKAKEKTGFPSASWLIRCVAVI
jgi:hypothetical protein